MPRDRHIVISRRALLAGTAAVVATTLTGLPNQPAHAASDAWAGAREIERRLADVERSLVRRFGSGRFPVTRFGAESCRLAPARLIYGFAAEGDAGTVTPAPDAPDCHAAFAAAIEACHMAGGGRVVVPAGNWYCAGPITLLSNVELHLSRGARIWFSPNPADYAKYGLHDFGANGKLVRSRWQGNDCYNYSPMVYAIGQQNIAVTGEDWTSVLDGQAGTPYDGTHCWWSWRGHRGFAGHVAGEAWEGAPNPANRPLSEVAPGLPTARANLITFGNPAGGGVIDYTDDRAYLPTLAEAGVPLERRVFGIGHQLRPSMIEFIACENVLLAGYQVTNAPFWVQHPVGCRNVIIRDVYANSLGPNNDGFDPEACDHVLVDHVTFNNGDDCIAIKSGQSHDTEFGPARNHLIQNCTMNSGHGGFTLGSEISAGAQNIFAQNLVMLNRNYATKPLNIAVRMKTNLNRGGTMENIHIRNLRLPNGVSLRPNCYWPLRGSPIPPGTVSVFQGGIITIDCDYLPGGDNVRTRPPALRNVTIADVTASPPPGSRASCYQPIIIQGPVAADYDGLTRPAPTVPPVRDIMISNCDFGTPTDAAHPIYLYNVENLTLSEVRIADRLYNTTYSAPAAGARRVSTRAKTDPGEKAEQTRMVE